MMKQTLRRLDELLDAHPRWHIALRVLLILAMTGIQWLLLDLSSGTRVIWILTRRFVYHPVDLALVFIVDLVFLLITRRWYRAYILGNIFFFIWSIANHYTFLFSGDVLTITALLSAGTAFDVLGGYRIVPDAVIIATVAAFVLNMAMVLFLRHLSKKAIPWKRLWLVLAAAIVLSGCAVGSVQLLQNLDATVWWTSRTDINQYGYPIYFLRQAFRAVNVFQRPDGYSDREMEALAEEYASQGRAGAAEQLPDIILILNETFYDLQLYTDVDADVPYLETYYSMENAVRGYAAIPVTGGGTNRAEYELLTSNSMFLLASQAPFNNVDMSRANSVVRYLKGLGYHSWGVHSASRSNYNRGTAYPALGFDETRFNDDFHSESYGDRPQTDAANYQDMFSWYQSSVEEDGAPQLMYLLTFQNHGGYEQNDSELDTVHTGRDFGDLTDDVDEFLSTIKLSDAALDQLLTYFNDQDRPVIVCMVGDHAPSFARSLPSYEDMTGEEQIVALRSTPFFIWANDAFGPIETADNVVLSVTDLVPRVLDIAGLPLSPYYQYLLDLSETIPLRLANGWHRTADGETGWFSEDDGQYGLLSPYYFMEYNNLQKPSDRFQALFDPPGAE